MEMQDKLHEADGNKEANNKGGDLKKKPALGNEIPSKETNLEDKKKEVEADAETSVDPPPRNCHKL